MKDPKPENIIGEKSVSHRVEHRVDWGWVAGGVGLLALAFVLYRIFGPTADDAEDSATFE
jgi:hypothetical protein